MHTFLPAVSYSACAAILDDRRLGKQRVECKQILLALQNPYYGWQNHPAVKMWRGYEYQLCRYGIAICREWSYVRNYRDTLLEYFVLEKACIPENKQTGIPPWLNEELINSHRSNLLRKDPLYYGRFCWGVPHDLEYVWPVS